jgi:threonine/homoserine/homoserine lactone efflux protein
MKLIPQFSLKSLFVITFVAAIFAWVSSRAAQGAEWAVALALMVVFGFITFCMFALFFLIAWPLSQYTERWSNRGKSPFLEQPTLPTE